MPVDLKEFESYMTGAQNDVNAVSNCHLEDVQDRTVEAFNNIMEAVGKLAEQLVAMEAEVLASLGPVPNPVVIGGKVYPGGGNTPVVNMPVHHAGEQEINKLEDQLTRLKMAVQNYMDQTPPFDGQPVTLASVKARDQLQAVIDGLED